MLTSANIHISIIVVVIIPIIMISASTATTATAAIASIDSFKALSLDLISLFASHKVHYELLIQVKFGLSAVHNHIWGLLLVVHFEGLRLDTEW